MMKKNFSILLILCISVYSCNRKEETGKFTVQGDIKNTPDQSIYLEQLFFSQKDPEVLDTAFIKNGQFTLTGIGAEEGLYRLRMEKMPAGFLFINDQPSIRFSADAKDLGLESTIFQSPANSLLKKLITQIETKRKAQIAVNEKLEQLQATPGSDSLMAIELTRQDELKDDFQKYIIRYIDSSSNPVVAMFALGYTQNIEPGLLEKPLLNLANRFPKHNGVASIMQQYKQMMAQQLQLKEKQNKFPHEGSLAPDITMNDTEGKPFSLSQLKGKFVLVDFWASWCGPCRGENPNVVAAYNKYKDKNFTVLGVSLDEDKDAWLKAIKDDNLTWKQISDLKGWQTSAVPLYGFEGIPYNVLIDPQGMIIATSLRESALQQKLEEVLK
jgi:peroxiredoxin